MNVKLNDNQMLTMLLVVFAIEAGKLSENQVANIIQCAPSKLREIKDAAIERGISIYKKWEADPASRRI
jgi:hypothetical protein